MLVTNYESDSILYTFIEQDYLVSYEWKYEYPYILIFLFYVAYYLIVKYVGIFTGVMQFAIRTYFILKSRLKNVQKRRMLEYNFYDCVAMVNLFKDNFRGLCILKV